jgi:hypothetical protein
LVFTWAVVDVLVEDETDEDPPAASSMAILPGMAPTVGGRLSAAGQRFQWDDP